MSKEGMRVGTQSARARRYIEAGFPCHQVGAETQRERDTGLAPPTHRLHVWWARRPLTPSRAAILASLLPDDTDPDWFLRQLGIEKVQALVNGEPWTLVEDIVNRIESDGRGAEWLSVDESILGALRKEDDRRAKNREIIHVLYSSDPSFQTHPVVQRWKSESRILPQPWPRPGDRLEVRRVAADPAHVNERIAFRERDTVRAILNDEFRWDVEDLYGYRRAFERAPANEPVSVVVLDPTAGGGSIPFEALRLGLSVVCNEINPVATVVLHATLEYPLLHGPGLIEDISLWGHELLERFGARTTSLYPYRSHLPVAEQALLRERLRKCPEVFCEFNFGDSLDYLYCRAVTCPHCEGEAPLLNTCWLSKENDKWAVRIVPDGQKHGGKVRFETHRVLGGRGPNGEDPDFATVNKGVGRCIHCGQAIDEAEIKAQARGESRYGKWKDRLYCVAAVRLQPKLDKNGLPRRYKSGQHAGEIITEKVRFFRPPNEADLKALSEAERMLEEHWSEWDRQGLIPTESLPIGYNTAQPLSFGMKRWCDMFTPRQLLGHVIAVEELSRLKPQIIEELGQERGRAVVTYLQFVLDKCLDYNSKQTRWEYTRSIVKGTFGRHDFWPKWIFGEMVLSGPSSGLAWALSQVVDAYKGIAELLQPVYERLAGKQPPVRILFGTAAKLEIPDASVDLICIDPPYYNNVQYAELSDYFYVWQRRTLADLYPTFYLTRLTNKLDEATANPVRHGSRLQATKEYERLMREIFTECRRVLKPDGIMTLMFTHKTQEAWETLTRSLIESGWAITSSMPVESESSESMHLKEKASAKSSVFISCRKQDMQAGAAAVWRGVGGTGVASHVREAVRMGLKQMEHLKLNPVDEMVASYGKALQVLAENWPVLDGDERVSPRRAMSEAAAVVAEYQVIRVTEGRLKVSDLKSEAAMALIAFSVFGLGEFAYDEALNMARALNVKLETKAGGPVATDGVVGITQEVRVSRSSRKPTLDRDRALTGYHAPFIARSSKMRLARPEERSSQRLEQPQTEWDMLCGLIVAYDKGDLPVAKAYLERQAGTRAKVVIDLLRVWAEKVGEESLSNRARALLFDLEHVK